MKKEIFDYLDEIRETGSINMMSAGSYLVEMFDISRKEAREYLAEWMRKNS